MQAQFYHSMCSCQCFSHTRHMFPCCRLWCSVQVQFYVLLPVLLLLLAPRVRGFRVRVAAAAVAISAASVMYRSHMVRESACM